MTTTPQLLIRDGIADDIPRCLNLDSSYETEYVWQMNIFQDVGEKRITFKQERLPRTLHTIYPVERRQLQLALSPQHCFIVASFKEDPLTLMGFLTMRHDPFHNMAIIHNIVVDTGYRRQKIGTRLLNIAHRWTLEHDIQQLIVETQTKNYPAIQFCQRAGLTFCGFSDQHFENQDIAVFFGQTLH